MASLIVTGLEVSEKAGWLEETELVLATAFEPAGRSMIITEAAMAAATMAA
jgi:hypothetical protein